MADSEDFNGKIIEEFRANGGKVGGWFEGQTLLLLHHTGAKSGTGRVNPLIYQQVGDSSRYSARRRAARVTRTGTTTWSRTRTPRPMWAPPRSTSGPGWRTRTSGTRSMPGRRKSCPNFADYEKSAAPREIPVILLDPVA